MQTKLPWLCAALLGLVGWLIGYSMSGDPAGFGANISTARDKAAPATPADSGATPAIDPETAALMKDFEQSAAAIMEDMNPLRQSHRLYQMVEHLSAAEMPGALNAALHLDPQKRFLLINGLIAHWAELDPRAAVEYASSLSKDQQYAWVRSNALAVWADKDFDAASQYALALAPGKQRNDALGGIVSGLAQKDPVRALKFFEENMKDALNDDSLNDYQSMIVHLWAAKDFDARGNAFSSIMYRWAEVDATASAKWLGTLPGGKSRDSAVRAFTDRITARDPEGAAQWAATITDESGRKSAVENVARNWMKRDKNAASAWIQTTNLLPEETRQRLLGTGKQ